MKSETALSIPEFCELVNEDSYASECFVFNHHDKVRDFKKGKNELFEKLPDTRKKFLYSITITALVNERNRRHVVASTQPGVHEGNSYKLLKKGGSFNP